MTQPNYDGAPQTSITVASPGYTLPAVGSDGSIKPNTTVGKFVVGQIINIDLGSGNTITGHKITIIGTFTDGGTQILWDRTL